MSDQRAPAPLHPQLAADCHHLGSVGNTRVLLHRNAALHWFVLVPDTSALDLTDLASSARQALMDLAARVGQLLKESLQYPRVNIGALGLLVPQLHLHVIGRRETDPCWPNPVWGALPDAGAWDAAALANIQSLLTETTTGYRPHPA